MSRQDGLVQRCLVWDGSDLEAQEDDCEHFDKHAETSHDECKRR